MDFFPTAVPHEFIRLVSSHIQTSQGSFAEIFQITPAKIGESKEVGWHQCSQCILPGSMRGLCVAWADTQRIETESPSRRVRRKTYRKMIDWFFCHSECVELSCTCILREWESLTKKLAGTIVLLMFISDVPYLAYFGWFYFIGRIPVSCTEALRKSDRQKPVQFLEGTRLCLASKVGWDGNTKKCWRKKGGWIWRCPDTDVTVLSMYAVCLLHSVRMR